MLKIFIVRDLLTNFWWHGYQIEWTNEPKDARFFDTKGEAGEFLLRNSADFQGKTLVIDKVYIFDQVVADEHEAYLKYR